MAAADENYFNIMRRRIASIGPSSPLPDLINVTTGMRLSRQVPIFSFTRHRIRPLFREFNPYQPPKENTITLSRTEFDTLCSEICPICLNTHILGHGLVTDCMHTFCKECYKYWINEPNSNRKCPVCRKDCPVVTYFALS